MGADTSDARHRPARHLARGLLAASLLAVGACAPAVEPQPEQDVPVVLADVLAEPRNHIGDVLRAEAVVSTLITDNAFTITLETQEAAEQRPGQGELVVVGPTTGLDEGARVVVAGTVRDTLEPEELEERYGSRWTDVMDEEYGGRAWLDAATVERAD